MLYNLWAPSIVPNTFYRELNKWCIDELREHAQIEQCELCWSDMRYNLFEFKLIVKFLNNMRFFVIFFRYSTKWSNNQMTCFRAIVLLSPFQID